MTFGGKDNRGPSIAELQRFVREQEVLIFTLSNDKEIVGKLRWFDENAFQIVVDGEQPFTILRAALVGYRKQSGGASSKKAKMSARASGAKENNEEEKTDTSASE